jgi:hypothetical protein
MRSVDSQALDLLASPNVVKGNLQRRVKYFQDGARQAAQRRNSGSTPQEVEETEVAMIQWWSPQKDDLLGGNERRVEGEIHLPQGLQPTSNFTYFTVEVS